MANYKSRRDFLKFLLISALVSGCDENFNKENNIEMSRRRQRNIPERRQEVREDYPNFRYRNELDTIRFHARRVGVDERLMLSIREAENGRRGRQFGIMPTQRYNNDRGYNNNGQFQNYPNDDDLSRQASWAAWTIRRNRERFERNNEGNADFIEYLSRRYAPLNADNDPNGLNNNWERNVRARYNVHSR